MFFAEFSKSVLIIYINFVNFQKKMTLIADIYPNLRTRKNVVR